MATLKQRIIDLVDVLTPKLNLLYTLITGKEDKSNKKTNLTSTDANHYPNVPAVKAGIDAGVATANAYTDTKVGSIVPSIPLSQKGANNGVAELDATGKVPTSQLPSYVDDVVDLVAFVTTNPTTGMVAGQKRYNSVTKKIFTSTSATAGTISDPEEDKIYVHTVENRSYRWSGTTMAGLDEGLALGTTSTTAARGDQGATAFAHVSKTDNPHNVTKAQVGLSAADNTSDALKPVSTAQQAALNLKANDTEVVKIAGTQTITGSKTFSLVPKSSQDATAATDLVRKSQLDLGLGAQETALGNPASNGQVLSSTTAGVRSWVAFPAGVTTYAGLSDKATVDLPTVNTPLATALGLKANDNVVVKTTGIQTIAGQKNFTTSPTSNSDATGANDIPRKSQMDAAIAVVQSDLGAGDIDYAAQLTAGLNF